MTPSTTSTLLTLFPIEQEQLKTDLETGPLSRNSWAASLPKGLWSCVAEEVAERYAELMAIRLDEVIFSGLKTSQEVIESANKSREKPDQDIILPLREQTLHSNHKPSVTVSIKGQSVMKVVFDVELRLDFKALILTLRGGRLTTVHTGKVIGSGSVKLEGVVLSKLTMTPIHLPGRLDLGEGIEILKG